MLEYGRGDAENVNPAINYRMYFTSGDTGGRENFDRINGIILESGDGRRFAAVWDEKQPDIGAMRIWDPDEGTREENRRKNRQKKWRRKRQQRKRRQRKRH